MCVIVVDDGVEGVQAQGGCNPQVLLLMNMFVLEKQRLLLYVLRLLCVVYLKVQTSSADPFCPCNPVVVICCSALTTICICIYIYMYIYICIEREIDR